MIKHHQLHTNDSWDPSGILSCRSTPEGQDSSNFQGNYDEYLFFFNEEWMNGAYSKTRFFFDSERSIWQTMGMVQKRLVPGKFCKWKRN